MKNRWIGYCVALLSVSASAQEYPRELTFSTGEQQIWQLTMQRPIAAREQVASALHALDISAPAVQALWWAQRCRFALQAGDKAALDSARVMLKQLEARSSSEFAGSAAGYKCQQLSKFNAGESMDTRQLSFLAYHSLTERDAPALHAWIGLDYARDALAAGFADSAASAVALVLSIARDNLLTQLEADSLAVQAEVQTALGQYPEALRSIHQALALQTDASQQQQVTADAGRDIAGDGAAAASASLVSDVVATAISTGWPGIIGAASAAITNRSGIAAEPATATNGSAKRRS